MSAVKSLNVVIEPLSIFVVKAYIANPSCCGVLTMPMSKWTSEEGRAFLGDSGRFVGR